jgi:hypothetical protein
MPLPLSEWQIAGTRVVDLVLASAECQPMRLPKLKRSSQPAKLYSLNFDLQLASCQVIVNNLLIAFDGTKLIELPLSAD